MISSKPLPLNIFDAEADRRRPASSDPDATASKAFTTAEPSDDTSLSFDTRAATPAVPATRAAPQGPPRRPMTPDAAAPRPPIAPPATLAAAPKRGSAPASEAAPAAAPSLIPAHKPPPPPGRMLPRAPTADAAVSLRPENAVATAFTSEPTKLIDLNAIKPPITSSRAPGMRDKPSNRFANAVASGVNAPAATSMAAANFGPSRSESLDNAGSNRVTALANAPKVEPTTGPRPRPRAPMNLNRCPSPSDTCGQTP